MRDRLFFPLAFILASTFIFLALQPFAERLPSGPVSAGVGNAEDITVKDVSLYRFQPGEFESISILPASGDQPVLARLTRPTSEDYLDPRRGPHLILAEDIEFAMGNRQIQIDIEARSAGEFAASQFEANYLVKPEFESGWRTFNLTSEFATYSFTYETPELGNSFGNDFLGIRPVAPDKHRVMEVRSVRIHTLTPKTF
jgi:hypothetical protein